MLYAFVCYMLICAYAILYIVYSICYIILYFPFSRNTYIYFRTYAIIIQKSYQKVRGSNLLKRLSNLRFLHRIRARNFPRRCHRPPKSLKNAPKTFQNPLKCHPRTPSGTILEKILKNTTQASIFIRFGSPKGAKDLKKAPQKHSKRYPKALQNASQNRIQKLGT